MMKRPYTLPMIIAIPIVCLIAVVFLLHDIQDGLYVMIGISMGIIVLILMIFRPFYGLLSIIIVNQFDNFIVLPLSSTAGRLIGVLVALGWFLKYFYRRQTIFFELLNINKIALLFIISMLASSLLSSYPLLSLKIALTITLLTMMIFFVQDFVRSKKELNLIIITIALSVGISSLIGVLQYNSLLIGDQSMGTVLYEGEEHIARVAGLTLNPNGYAVMLLSGIPFLLFLSLNATNLSLKLISILLFFTSIISLGLTLSRTNIYGFGVFLFIFIALNFKFKNITKKQFAILFIILVLLTSLVTIFLFDVIKQRAFSFEDSSSGIRMLMISKGLNLFIEHPLLGIGFGNFEFLDTSDNKFGNIYGRPGHDIVSVPFVSTGAIGASLLIILCFKTLRHLNSAAMYLTKLNDKYLCNLICILKSAFIALLLTGIGNPIVFQRIFWIYIALASIIYRWSSSRFITMGNVDPFFLSKEN
ncbi:MAG: O-antigen ligase family protein [Thermodesulfovibrionales bacterium]|nr:O-antigen ligase family protein [Thermodesulfovibrionales bacterium]